MENTGVVCDVCECAHNCGCNKCDLAQIEVTEQSVDATMETPHFCKSYEKK